MTKITPIIIVGGSAGSLEPLQSLFKTLPEDSGYAFIVVQHLPKTHESLMPGLLSKCTTMPVITIDADTRIETNNVYLPEPGEFITIDNNQLLYQASFEETQAHHPIDVICQSLRKNYHQHAHLVILSGTGFDGLAGAKAIKQLAGKVIVQAPGSASYPGMPNEIIKMKLDDAVLQPKEIASFLTDIGKMNKNKNTDKPKNQVSLESCKPIIDLLSKHVRQDINEYKGATIHRRIARRMELNKIRHVNQYLQVLHSKPDEIELLAKDLLIGVTSFFRDQAAFDVIEKKVIPALVKQCKGETPVRVWVAGCSTGEEAYSVAILLIEHLKKINRPLKIQIFATDLDNVALDTGRNGVYTKEALQRLPANFINEYFIDENDKYRVKKILRECIVFANHNLLADPPFSKIDFVVCRNLLIYLDAKAQKRLLSLFEFILNKSGYLFLGSAESVGSIAEHFDVISKKWRIYQYNSTVPKLSPTAPYSINQLRTLDVYSPSLLATATATATATGKDKLNVPYQEIIENYGPAQVLIDADNKLVFMTGNSSDYFSLPKGKMSVELNKCLMPQLQLPVRSIIHESRSKNKHVSLSIELKNDNTKSENKEIIIDSIAVNEAENPGLVLLLFQKKSSSLHKRSTVQDEGESWVLRQLEQELNATRDDLNNTIQQSIITAEETRAVNEEMLSMNEELQSSNEELESSKEELQSLNEELLSTNSNLDAKLTENDTLNDDLNNLLLSSTTATLLINKDFTIHLFTPACKKIFRIIESDIGRPLDDLVKLFEDDELISDCRLLIADEQVSEKEIVSKNNKYFLRRLFPYLNKDKNISGVVISFIDISKIKATENLMQEKNDLLQWQADLLENAAPIIGFDKERKIIFWNQSAYLLYGWSKEEAIGKDVSILLKTEYSTREKEIRLILKTNGKWMGELIHTKKDGGLVIVDSQWTQFLGNDGELKNIVEVNNDITERKEIQEQLHSNETMFHTMVDWTYDLEYWQSTDGSFIYITPSIKRLTGYSASDFINDPDMFRNIVVAEDMEFWNDFCAANAALKEDDVNKAEWRIRHKNGEERWLSFTSRVIYDQDECLGLRVSARDVSREKETDEEMLRLAYYDSLTQLPNRRLMLDRLKQMLNKSVRSGQYVAVLLLDLDYFKQINDSKGHDAGDRLLVEVAARLTDSVRHKDTVSRLGGDEFLILLEDMGSNVNEAAGHAEETAEKVRRSLRFDYLDKDDVVNYRNSVSIGISLITGMEFTQEEILKQADLALYRSKEDGRDAIRFFDPEMQASIEKLSEVKSKLHASITNNELVLYFQPQYDKSNRIFGAEALIRWFSEKDKMVSPEQFIPLAEETGFIHELGAWVLKQATRQLKIWEADARFKEIELAVNISVKQIMHQDFLSLVKAIVKESDCNPSRLKLEITESLFITNLEEVLDKMHALAKIGLSFSLDDFGTGYSSLSTIRELPISELKIDQSFIRHVYKDPDHASIVKAVLAMAKSLGIQVVAEGVETEKEKKYLFEHGCDLLQGYYYSKPVSIEDWQKLKQL